MLQESPLHGQKRAQILICVRVMVTRKGDFLESHIPTRLPLFLTWLYLRGLILAHMTEGAHGPEVHRVMFLVLLAIIR